LAGAVLVFRDITEHKRVEERLRASQKMEAVGRLAGGVAHDFNNLLMVMRGYGELMLNQLDANDPLRRNAEEIQKAAERATALTQQLLAFSRKQVLQPKVLDLNTVVTEVEKMLRRLIGEDIELATTLDPALGPVKADPGQIEQIILNLAVNARDAMPQGGRLTLKTANVTLDQAYVRQHMGATLGPYVLLAVSDTGVGMDAETQSHIFEPFFTTKGAGKGTGLGLSTVYGIVKQSGGTIWVESAPGRGTTFEIYLPLVEEAAASGELHPALPAPTPGGSETILVVEDEMSVRKLAAEFLGSNGYRVLEAQDGGEALQVCEEHRAPIHLLMTDVVMPGMSGRELAVRLVGARPEMKVIYVSGYTDDAIVQHGVREEGTVFLQKPFSLETLAHTVREVLDSKGKE
jgi:nitrogen-specific signal transduction histidine kinase/ActR/RegA family two-component response regulator